MRLPQSRTGLAVLVFALCVGAWVGSLIVDYLARPGFESLSAGVVIIIAIAVVGALVVAAVVAALLPGRRGRPVATGLISAAIAFAIGVGLGSVLGRIVGVGYQEVRREARGTIDLMLDGIADYTAQVDVAAYCGSEPHSENVATIQGVGIGRIGADSVVASVSMTPPDQPPVVRIWIEHTTNKERDLPVWEGPASHVPLPAGLSGLGFTNIPLVEGGTGDPAGRWPQQLSGRLGWSCEAWIPE